MGDRGHNRHPPKRGGLLCPFCGGGAGSPSNTMWHGPRSTSVQSGVFIHPDVWPQYAWAKNWVGAVPCFLGGGVGSPSNTVAWVEAYLHTKWHLSPSSRLATTDIGRKLGECASLRRGAGSPSNTMSPTLRHTSVPSGILVNQSINQSMILLVLQLTCWISYNKHHINLHNTKYKIK